MAATGPGRNVSGTVPIQNDAPRGTATPMQFGPTMAALASLRRPATRRGSAAAPPKRNPRGERDLADAGIALAPPDRPAARMYAGDRDAAVKEVVEHLATG